MSVAQPQSVSTLTSVSARNKKSTGLLRCFWLVPSPRYFAKLRKSGLLQRAVAGAGLRADVVADHARLVTIEMPLAGLRVLRIALHRVGGGRTGARGSAGDNCEYVAALYRAGQDCVDQARTRRAAARAAHGSQVT